MIWNDLSGEEEEKDSGFIEDEEREGSTDLFAENDDFEKRGTVFPCKPDQKLSEDVYI